MPDTTALQHRLAELGREWDKGQQQLRQLDQQRQELEHTMLRISGAMQVLRELLNSDSAGNDAVDRSPLQPVTSAASN